MANLFAYGTLQFPEVVKKLTGRTFRSIPARLEGFKRCRVKNCDYPALVSAEGSQTLGMLLIDVDMASWKILDNFEGDEYLRIAVRVSTEESEVPAQVYVWTAEMNRLEDLDWDIENFKENYFAGYL